MTKLGTRTLTVLGALLSIVACNEIAGIHEPMLRSEGSVPCSTVADCKIEAPECRTAMCKDGACVFHDVPEGTALSDQTAGDCAERVCDGAGKVRLDPLPTDVLDDHNVCTLDTCEGTIPKNTIQAEVPCYTGSAATRGVGDCHDGVWKCDAQGNLIDDACQGETLPGVETCLKDGDEDCDGKANEGGEGCACVPGEVRDCYTGALGTEGVGPCHGGKQSCEWTGVSYGPCEDEQVPEPEVCDAAKVDENCNGQINEGSTPCNCGDGVVDSPDAGVGMEECDDGNTDDTDDCTNACKKPVCGDGITQPGHGEACDGGPLCLPSCTWTTVVTVVAGGSHTCVVFANGRLKCWGANSKGQLGLGDTSARGDNMNEMGENLPVVGLDPSLPIAGVGAGSEETCARTSAGTVKCWGSNGYGQLGLGDKNNRGDNPNEMGTLPSVSLGSGETATAFRGGLWHMCALLSGGAVKCWGENSKGQLGLGDISTRGDQPGEMGNSLPRVDLGTGQTASAITAGWTHSCVVLKSPFPKITGPVKCWGENSKGQLGLGNTAFRGKAPGEMGDNLPAVDLGTTNNINNTALAVSAGVAHTCALLSDGTVKCWGASDAGQLGLGDASARGDQ